MGNKTHWIIDANNRQIHILPLEHLKTSRIKLTKIWIRLIMWLTKINLNSSTIRSRLSTSRTTRVDNKTVQEILDGKTSNLTKINRIKMDILKILMDRTSKTIRSNKNPKRVSKMMRTIQTRNSSQVISSLAHIRWRKELNLLITRGVVTKIILWTHSTSLTDLPSTLSTLILSKMTLNIRLSRVKTWNRERIMS